MVCEVHFSLEKLRIKHAQAHLQIVQGILISIMQIDERDALRCFVLTSVNFLIH